MARFTTDFITIPACSIRTGGLPCGRGLGHAVTGEILSSLPGHFTLSADTARVIGDLAPLREALRQAA